MVKEGSEKLAEVGAKVQEREQEAAAASVPVLKNSAALPCAGGTTPTLRHTQAREVSCAGREERGGSKRGQDERDEGRERERRRGGTVEGGGGADFLS